MRRSQDDIEADILKIVSARGVTGKTAIVYGANLNFRIVKGYLARLVERGLLKLEMVGDRERYSVGPMAEVFVDTLAMLRGISA